MPETVSATYPWIKAFHVIAVITWMAGLFYLPRLFVYHAERGTPGSELSEVFKVMERKLERQIMLPAMLASWILGLLLILAPRTINLSSDHWIYVKLAAVVVLTFFHFWLARRRRDFAEDRNQISGRRYRLLNEVPTVALIVIVIMVIVRPF